MPRYEIDGQVWELQTERSRNKYRFEGGFPQHEMVFKPEYWGKVEFHPRQESQPCYRWVMENETGTSAGRCNTLSEALWACERTAVDWAAHQAGVWRELDAMAVMLANAEWVEGE